MDFAVPAEHKVKLKEGEKKVRFLELASKLKNNRHKSNGYTNCNWYSWYSHQRFGTGTGGERKKRTSGDHLNFSIVKIGQNTEKSPGNMRGLTVIQTPVKNHQLQLV